MQSLKKNRGYTGTQESFAHGLNFYKLFWIFFFGCFLGVVVENIWCLITCFKFESRQGLIYGPFNLVYGFGALAMTLGLYWLRNKRDSWIFLGGAAIGGVYEYVCSWLQEMMFGTVSWQYDHMPFNLHGRINLLYCLFWGALALLWVKGIYPLMCRWIAKIPNSIGKGLTWVLLVFMVFNTVISAIAVDRMTKRHDNIPPENGFETFIDRHYDDDFMHWVYPNMVYVE